MRTIIAFLLLIIYVNAWKTFHNGRLHGGNLPPPPGPKIKSRAVEEKYFEQYLDHFQPSDTTTWKQKYFVNDEFFTSKNVAFLMIGGEGPASDVWMTQGAWIDTAKTYGALIFQVEHRFYGDSLPTQNYSTENLRYLSSEQALADLATFISAMNAEYSLPDDVKWIAFGGSYSGSLAAWLRQKYPHLVLGAMSASGPLLALLDFEDYYKVVADDLVALHSQQCADNVQKAFEQIQDFVSSGQNLTDLDALFSLCAPLEQASKDDITNFFSALAGNFAGIAQYNNDNRGDDTITVNTLCDLITKEGETELNGLAAINDLLLDSTGQTCLNVNYEQMIEYYKQEDMDTGGGRQWLYQTCTEFGFYQTSNHKPQVFGDRFPLDFSLQQCKDIYGDKFNEDFLNRAMSKTNTEYGALNIQVSNVVFVHGTVDPWHPLGITETVDPEAPAILINGTSHCANMYPRTDSDPPQLADARNRVDELIGQWLQQ